MAKKKTQEEAPRERIIKPEYIGARIYHRASGTHFTVGHKPSMYDIYEEVLGSKIFKTIKAPKTPEA